MMWSAVAGSIADSLTTVYRGLSLHVEVEPLSSTGLDTTSHVRCELLRSINERRLVHRLGAVDSTVVGEASTIVRTLLNL